MTRFWRREASRIETPRHVDEAIQHPGGGEQIAFGDDVIPFEHAAGQMGQLIRVVSCNCPIRKADGKAS